MIYSELNSLVQKFLLTGITILLAIACTKDVPVKPKEIIHPLPDDAYFVKATECDEISSTLIRSTVQLAGYSQFTPYLNDPIKLYRIIYRTSYRGDSILASGLIAYPLNKKDSLPAMYIGNGLTFADRDAPSSFRWPVNYTGFEFIASMGYFTLIPDMIGFGVSANLIFPIHNYEHSATAMIDFIYASREFVRAKGLMVKNENYMAGYSQGGHIAMSTLKMIEENQISDIQIRATAVGAGGYNIINILQDAIEKNSYSAPSHLILLFSSYNQIYEWNRPMTDFFREPYAGKIPLLLSGKYDRNEIDAQLAYSFDSLLNPDFLSNLKTNNEPEVIAAFAANNVDDWSPKSILNLIHSTNDDRIPISDSQDAYNKMVLNGSTSVMFTPITTQGHVESGVAFVEKVILWLNSLN